MPEELAGAFAEAVLAAAARMHPHDSDDYTAVIHDAALARQRALLDDARAQGARVLAAAMPADGRRLPLHVVLGVTPQMRLAREEIFGPILPVMTYRTFDEAIACVQRGTRPLALYYFGHDKAETGPLLERTHAGGVTLNDWGWHVVNHDLPFGGTGTSGMGNYHGAEGFRELSHAKAVFSERRWFPIALFHPPYGGRIQRLALRLFLGKPHSSAADAALPAGTRAVPPATPR
ncbi:Coniferyl aldehyde dehydrogenase [compost metagenome]